MTRGPPAVTSPGSTTSSNSRLQLPQSCDPPGPSNPPKQRVWVIFGGSGHIGRSVLKAALMHGDIVTAVGKLHEDTLQSMAALVPAASSVSPLSSPSSARSSPVGTRQHQQQPQQDHQQQQQARHPHPRYQPLVCDVRVPASVRAAVQGALSRWGRIDVIANCSGYGVIGACEDQDDADIRGQLETNFFGALNVIQASLPYFRARGSGKLDASGSDDEDDDEDDEDDGDMEDGDGETESPEDATSTQHAPPLPPPPRRRRGPPKRRGGRYLIFSSTSGALGVPGLGPYCATKYAVEGLVESLLYEIDAFGIRATLVEPGHVRRDDVLDGAAAQDVARSRNLSIPPALLPPGAASPANGGSSALPTFGHFFVKPPSAPYSGLNAPAAHARRMVQWLGDQQPTSAVRAAELVWQLAHCRYPPLRLLLGTYAVDSVRDRLRTIIEEIEDWKFLNFGGQPQAQPAHAAQGQQDAAMDGESDGEDGTAANAPTDSDARNGEGKEHSEEHGAEDDDEEGEEGHEDDDEDAEDGDEDMFDANADDMDEDEAL